MGEPYLSVLQSFFFASSPNLMAGHNDSTNNLPELAMKNVDVFDALYQAAMRRESGYSRGAVTVIGNRSLLIENPVLVGEDNSVLMAEMTMFYSPLAERTWRNVQADSAVITLLKAEPEKPETQRVIHLCVTFISDENSQMTHFWFKTATHSDPEDTEVVRAIWNPDGTLNVEPMQLKRLGTFFKERL